MGKRLSSLSISSLRALHPPEPWQWLCLLFPVPLALPSPRKLFWWRHHKMLCKAGGFQPKTRHKYKICFFFSCQQVRIMAFLYATPATQNNSLLTIAAIPGILQNHKCCFIYKKLLEMIKQSMPARWAGALCTAPREPAFPERLLLIKVNILYTCLPKSHTVSKCFAIPLFSPFTTNASIVLLNSAEYRGLNTVTEVGSPKMKVGGGGGLSSPSVLSTIHCWNTYKTPVPSQ